MKYNLNSNVFPIINIGMYESNLDPKYSLNSEEIDDDYKEGFSLYTSEEYWDNFDNYAYEQHILSVAKDCYDKKYEIDGIQVKITLGSIYSPRQYNFATDNVDMEVIVNKPLLLQYAYRHQVKFNNFLHENYTSYDGFMSFTANNYKAWLKNFNKNDVQEVGAILTFLFRNDRKEMQEEFVEVCLEELYYHEFMDAEYIPIMQNLKDEIKDFIQENYMKFSRDALIAHCIKESDFDVNDIDRIAKEVLDDIDNCTIALF